MIEVSNEGGTMTQEEAQDVAEEVHALLKARGADTRMYVIILVSMLVSVLYAAKRLGVFEPMLRTVVEMFNGGLAGIQDAPAEGLDEDEIRKRMLN